jgi:hypothetical protein
VQEENMVDEDFKDQTSSAACVKQEYEEARYILFQWHVMDTSKNNMHQIW